ISNRRQGTLRYASCAIAPVGRCCSILLWHVLLSLPGSRLDLLRDALSLAGHVDAGLPGKPETGVTPLQSRAHRGSAGRSRRIGICAAPNIPARLRAHLVVPYRLRPPNRRRVEISYLLQRHPSTASVKASLHKARDLEKGLEEVTPLTRSQVDGKRANRKLTVDNRRLHS